MRKIILVTDFFHQITISKILDRKTLFQIIEINIQKFCKTMDNILRRGIILLDLEIMVVE